MDRNVIDNEYQATETKLKEVVAEINELESQMNLYRDRKETLLVLAQAYESLLGSLMTNSQQKGQDSIAEAPYPSSETSRPHFGH